jgi:hypothetical protein
MKLAIRSLDINQPGPIPPLKEGCGRAVSFWLLLAVCMRDAAGQLYVRLGTLHVRMIEPRASPAKWAERAPSGRAPCRSLLPDWRLGVGIGIGVAVTSLSDPVLNTLLERPLGRREQADAGGATTTIEKCMRSMLSCLTIGGKVGRRMMTAGRRPTARTAAAAPALPTAPGSPPGGRGKENRCTASSAESPGPCRRRRCRRK